MKTEDFIKLLFDRADAAGLTEYEVYCSSGKSFFVNVQNGEPEKYTVNSFTGISFRAKQDGRIGYCSTTAAEPELADFLVRGVLENLSVLTGTDEQFIFEGSKHYEEVNGYSAELAALSDAEKIDYARRIEKAAMQQEGIVRVMNAAVAYGEGEVYISNSKGLNLHSRDNYIYAYCIPIASDGQSANNGMAYAFATSADGIEPEKLAAEAAEKALAGLHPDKVKTGSYKAVFSGETMGDLLATFSSVFSADAAQKGISLLAGKENTVIASSAVTLRDDPLSPLAPLRSAFDDEGVATKSKAVIDKGVLTTLLHNLKTAHKAGTESTGNGSKAGYASSVSVSPRCFFIEPSDITQQQLLARMGDGLYITALNGLHSGANPASGDFSLSAKGYTVCGGKKERAIADFTVTGNFYSLLKDIEAVSSVITWGLPPETGSPDVMVSSLMVSGE